MARCDSFLPDINATNDLRSARSPGWICAASANHAGHETPSATWIYPRAACSIRSSKASPRSYKVPAVVMTLSLAARTFFVECFRLSFRKLFDQFTVHGFYGVQFGCVCFFGGHLCSVLSVFVVVIERVDCVVEPMSCANTRSGIGRGGAGGSAR